MSADAFIYRMHKEISSFASQVSSIFKLLMVHFTAEYRSSDHSKMSYHHYVVVTASVMKIATSLDEETTKTALKESRTIEKHLLPVL